jgi:nitric oxide reductase NorD protein
MALDEYLFGKVASFFKQRNLKNNEARDRKVTLDEHRQRFTILARAITGHSIELFAAEREGGYKGNSFFLPNSFAQFPTFEQNLSYYFFRIIYLSVQKNLKLNWFQSDDIQNDTAQQIAIQNAPIRAARYTKRNFHLQFRFMMTLKLFIRIICCRKKQ